MIPGLTCHHCHQPISGKRGAPMTHHTPDGLLHTTCPQPAARKNPSAQLNADRLEDLAWMAETGETRDGAAARLGMSVESLGRWCEKHARDLWAALGREPAGAVRSVRVPGWRAA